MHDAERRERDLDAESARGSAPIQPFGASTAVSAMPGDRGRQREREVDERVEDAPARELVAHERPARAIDAETAR